MFLLAADADLADNNTIEPQPDGEHQAAGVVVIAASAGGPRALFSLLEQLQPGFPLPVIVLQHLQPERRSLLATLLGRRCRLPVTEATDGEPLRPGHVYVAPPDRHLSIEQGGTLRLSSSPKLHFLRPAADILFQSAADVFDGNVIAVVLSGTGTDAAAGAHAIRKQGGRVIVQDRATAEFFGMPGTVIARGDADAVMPLHEIGGRLATMAAEA